MFDSCLYFNTTSLARLIECEWAKAFVNFGLTPPQAFMLRAVCEKPGLKQGELAETLTIKRSTATRTLDGLEKKGLIVRKKTTQDGREFTIHPTTKASSLNGEIVAASRAVSKRLQREMGETNFEEIIMKIRKARNSFK